MGVPIWESMQYNLIYFLGQQETILLARGGIFFFLLNTKEKTFVDMSLLYQTPISVLQL